MRTLKKSFLKGALLAIGSFAATSQVEAQQIPFYSQYYVNPFIYNPAKTGAGDSWNAYAIRRDQWANFKGAPVTNAFTIDGPIQGKKAGLGLNIYSDKAGIINRTGAYANYSYRVDFSDVNKLYFGLSAGVINNNIDFASIDAKNPSQITSSGEFDPNKSTFDASAGFNYVYKNLEIGASVPQLFSNKISYAAAGSAKNFYSLNRHYLGALKYNFEVNKSVNVYPLVLVRYAQGIPMQIDGNVVLDWKNRGWLAATYKSNFGYSVSLGLRYAGFTFGYAYDIVNPDISSYTGGGSEIIIGYAFGASKSEDKPKERKPVNIENKEYQKRVAELDKKVKQLQILRARDKKLIDTLQQEIKRLNFDKKATPEVGTIYKLKNVYFDLESTKLTMNSKETLEDVIEYLNNNPTVRIDIQGHTDATGSDEYNNELSIRRAKLVYDYLVNEGGIAEDRLAYHGFGKTKPLVSGTSERAMMKNRRIEFQVVSK